MLFREAIIQVKGFRFIAGNTPVYSPAGRRFLYDTSLVTNAEQLEKVQQLQDMIIDFLEKNPGGSFSELADVKDIPGTLNRLEERCLLGDIELFEIKELSVITRNIKDKIEKYNLPVVNIPDLSEVINLLDPEKTGNARFYIYDLYDKRLVTLRKAIRKETDELLREKLREQENEIEDEIRQFLSEELWKKSGELRRALEELAKLDVLLGKATLAIQWKLCRPVVSTKEIVYEKLIHPEVRYQLEQRGLNFQPVDITVLPEATVITGANMAGKSVLLKSLMLAQYMAQFGYRVCAEKARLVPVDTILVSMGDEQDEQRGLSSFASEMININRIIHATKQGKKILALIDEPARTTNPEEGKAIVNALIKFLNKYNVMSVVTTHYGSLDVSCRKLRVRGFMENRIDRKLSLDNINSFIDYTLEEDSNREVPHEALRIAEILDIDSELIDNAKKYLKTDNGKK